MNIKKVNSSGGAGENEINFIFANEGIEQRHELQKYEMHHYWQWQ